MLDICIQVFGFEGDAPSGGHRRLLSDAKCDLDNASALSNALFVSMNTPWLLCFIAYSFLHLTYGNDREECAQFISQDKAPGEDPQIEMEQVRSNDDEDDAEVGVAHSVLGDKDDDGPDGPDSPGGVPDSPGGDDDEDERNPITGKKP